MKTAAKKSPARRKKKVFPRSLGQDVSLYINGLRGKKEWAEMQRKLIRGDRGFGGRVVDGERIGGIILSDVQAGVVIAELEFLGNIDKYCDSKVKKVSNK